MLHKIIALLGLSVQLLACGSDGESVPGAISAAAPFAATGDIQLEESDSVINVMPEVRADPLGGYLVADFQEAQVRRYHEDGSLAFATGRKGSGPGEFAGPTVAIRLPSRQILAVDGNVRSVLFSESADSILATFGNPPGMIDDVDVLADGTVLFSGRGSFDEPERMHIIEIPSGRVLRGIFTPPHAARFRAAAATAGITTADVKGDTIAAAYALSDTVYLMTADGSTLQKIPIPFRRFRHISSAAPASADMQAMRDWIGSFSLISGVHWRHDGGFLVQYQDRVNMLPRWNLLGMNRRGEWEFEVTDWTKVLVVSDTTPDIVFISPNSEVPSQWSTATYRE